MLYFWFGTPWDCPAFRQTGDPVSVGRNLGIFAKKKPNRVSEDFYDKEFDGVLRWGGVMYPAKAKMR